jgi:hypothetical protein
MKHTLFGSLTVMSFIALTSAGCSPAMSQPKSAIEVESITSTTSITSGEALPTFAAEPLPANHAPLDSWFRGTPGRGPDAPTKSAAQPLDPWSYP